MVSGVQEEHGFLEIGISGRTTGVATPTSTEHAPSWTEVKSCGTLHARSVPPWRVKGQVELEAGLQRPAILRIATAKRLNEGGVLYALPWLL